MKKYQFTALMALAVTCTTGFTACSSEDIGEDNQNVVIDSKGTAGVKSEFVVSIPRTVVGTTTRQTNAITQNLGEADQFRGIDNIVLIPFGSEPTSTTSKLSDIMNLSAITALNKPGTVNYKVYNDKFVPVGTKYFLFYGKATDIQEEEPITDMDDKFHYGILHAKGLTEDEFTAPKDIVIALEQINTKADLNSTDGAGSKLLKLLTDLANITADEASGVHKKWSLTTNFILATLYKNFIGLTTMSSDNVAVMLHKLYFSMDHVLAEDPARPLANAIKAMIESACTTTPNSTNDKVSLKAEYKNYPSSLGLPDGAVRIRWNASGSQANKFTDITANYNKNFKLKITDYCYPAALWYYVNTPLKASGDKKSDKYDGEGNWDGVITNVYKGAAEEVQAGTQSIALKDQVQYGVGRIETKIIMGEAPFYDGNGKEVSVVNGFTLKGLLIGGQNSVTYNFTSKGDENMAIYDRVMASNNIIAKPNSSTGTANQTLALETKKDQMVHAALELVNNGEDFMGFDGIIPKGGTFYLAMKLDPTKAVNYDEFIRDKIVQQDHVTKLTVTIRNGGTFVDRNEDGKPDKYVKDEDGKPIGVDTDGDGDVDPYDIDNDGNDDKFITDPDHGGPGWDTDGDGEVDIPVLPDPETGEYPNTPNVPDGLGGATNGVPDLTSPGIELGTSVNLEWQEGLILEPKI